MPDMDTSRAPRDALYIPLGNSLFQLILSRANKAEIFAHALAKLSETRKESLSILWNLGKWNADIATLFSVRSVESVIDTPFRLIYPNSALSSFDETSGLYVRQYIAVSYCWRSGDFLPVNCERQNTWPISQPFVDAILSHLDHPREGIWMDQLCIDQSSSLDKQRSVAAMDIIYRSCIRLVVLLEDVFLSVKEAELHVKYDAADKQMDGMWVPEDAEEAEAFEGFYTKINSARWWERAWCYHEFMVNEPWNQMRQQNLVHNATFVLNVDGGGTVKIKWVNLQLIMSSAMLLMNNEVSRTAHDFKGQAIFACVQQGDGDGWRDSLMGGTSGWRSSIMARHNGVAVKGSTYLTDRLSVMINMCGLGLAYNGPELKSKDELLFLASSIALAAGETYPLTMMGGDSVTLNDMPTWLTRSAATTDTSIPRFLLDTVRHVHHISHSTIELDMLFFNASWLQPFNVSLDDTFQIFPSTITTIPPNTNLPLQQPHLYATQSQPDTMFDSYRRRFLASCILNGYHFISRLWKQLRSDVVESNYNTGIFTPFRSSPSMLAPAQCLLACLLPVSIALFGLPAPSTFTLLDAQAFLTWLADPRSLYYISMYTYRIPLSPSSSSSSPSEAAICTGFCVNQAFSAGPLHDLAAALPLDVVGSSCIPLRLWILRRAGEGRWRMAGKGLLLGEPDLMRLAAEKGSLVQKTERVRVHG